MANCADITKYGIFDISSQSSSESLAASYLKWLSNREFSSSEQARNSSFNFGITLPKIPIGFSFGGGRAGVSSNSWGKEFTEYLKSDVAFQTQFDQEFRQANAKIVEAWSSCVLNKKGLSCWAEQSDNPKEILLKIEVKPLTGRMPRLKIEEIVTSSHVKPKESVKGEKLGVHIVTIIYERIGRNWHEAVNFDVETNDPDYLDSCSAPEILIGDAITGKGLKGLIAKWTGNENANDLIGKNHGTSTKVTYVEGIYNKAFKFTNEEDSRIVTPLTVSYQNGVTFSAWVRTKADKGVILADGGGASPGMGMGFFIEPGGKLLLLGSMAVDNVANFVIDAGQAISDDEFHHIASTWTGDTKKDGVAFYIDGVMIGRTAANRRIYKGSTHICMGGHDVLGYYKDFDGVIDDVSIYDRALTAQEIKKLSKR